MYTHSKDQLRADVANMQLSYMQLAVTLARQLFFSLGCYIMLRIAFAAASAAGFEMAVPELGGWIAEGFVGAILVVHWGLFYHKTMKYYNLLAYQQHLQQQRGGGTSTTSNGS